jgi:hypothetical protein
MGYEFSIILNREITEDESRILLDNCTGTTLSTAPLPTNADLSGTQLEVDNTEVPTLAEAIQAALDAVKLVPDVLPASLTVPAQPNGEPSEGEDGEAGEAVVPADGVVSPSGPTIVGEVITGEPGTDGGDAEPADGAEGPAEDAAEAADTTPVAVAASSESAE